MAFGPTHGRTTPRLTTAFGLLGLVLALGCGGKHTEVADEKADEAKPKAAGTAPAPAAAAPAKADAILRQPFDEATISEAPENQDLPAQTMTGKSVGQLYQKVRGLWDTITFATPAGKRVHYRAVLDTDEGVIEIELRPYLAPNHVRSFVALCRAGYYDGLVFERSVHEVSEVEGAGSVDYLEGGCPMGTGEPNYGSIGYWLKPEFNEQVHHEEGTVGAWHAEEEDTAACKFYITLTKAPIFDGNFTVFGKVTRGLDVAHKIAKRRPRDDDETKDHPETPAVIRKVTILTDEAAR